MIPGALVLDSLGEPLGRVVELRQAEGALVVALESGPEVTVPLSAVTSGAEGPVRLGYTREQLSAEPTLRLPLLDEEPETAVYRRSAGTYFVHRRVVEEERVLRVKVRREVLEVEFEPARHPVGRRGRSRHELLSTEEVAREELARIPLREEVADVVKSTRVYEEAVVTRAQVRELRKLPTRLRHETAKVDPTGRTGLEDDPDYGAV